MTSKPQPDHVNPDLARAALEQATGCNAVYSRYVLGHYQATGNLAPGCDARDLIAWLEANEPRRWAQLCVKGLPLGPSQCHLCQAASKARRADAAEMAQDNACYEACEPNPELLIGQRVTWVTCRHFSYIKKAKAVIR